MHLWIACFSSCRSTGGRKYEANTHGKDTEDICLEIREMPEEALAKAVDYCIENGILEEFLRKNREEGIRFTLEILKESNFPKEYAQKKLREKYSLSERESEQKLTQYWK